MTAREDLKKAGVTAKEVGEQAKDKFQDFGNEAKAAIKDPKDHKWLAAGGLAGVSVVGAGALAGIIGGAVAGAQAGHDHQVESNVPNFKKAESDMPKSWAGKKVESSMKVKSAEEGAKSEARKFLPKKEPKAPPPPAASVEAVAPPPPPAEVTGQGGGNVVETVKAALKAAAPGGSLDIAMKKQIGTAAAELGNVENQAQEAVNLGATEFRVAEGEPGNEASSGISDFWTRTWQHVPTTWCYVIIIAFAVLFCVCLLCLCAGMFLCQSKAKASTSSRTVSRMDSRTSVLSGKTEETGLTEEEEQELASDEELE